MLSLSKTVIAWIIDITAKLNEKISLREFICENMNSLQNTIEINEVKRILNEFFHCPYNNSDRL